MPCYHINAHMNNGFLCCVDCNRKLNGTLKQTKKKYKPSVTRPRNHEQCNCICHSNGHAFCLGCKNIHRISEDNMQQNSKLFRAQQVSSGYSKHKFRRFSKNGKNQWAWITHG
mgnify:CR=1 FL=1